MKTELMIDDWAGRQYVPVDVVGETPKRYRIKLRQAARLPGGRQRSEGDVVLVPKYAIRFQEEVTT